MRCPACDQAYELEPGDRLGFRETCAGCGADLHVCLTCAHHDPGAYNGCREPQAERVRDPDRANRCEYWRAADAGRGGEGAGDERAAAMQALENLFKDG